jgi:hypothetical protein
MEKNESEWKKALEKQAGLFRGMLEISCRQLEFCRREDLGSEDFTVLNELIGQRQALMDEIDRLHSSLPPEGAVSVAGGRPLPGYGEGGELAKVLDAISRNDEACLGLLRGKSRELAARLKETRVSRRAADAYSQGNSIQEAWFVDKKK